MVPLGIGSGTLLAALTALSLGTASCQEWTQEWPDDSEFEQIAPNLSAYDREVLADSPVLYLTMGHAQSTVEVDQSGHGNHGAYFPRDNAARTTILPNGDAAAAFDGRRQYLEVRDDDSLSISTTGSLTIEVWMRPDTLNFEKSEGSGYVHWAGKGEWHEHEYVLRMYSKITTDLERPNRISCYAYNLDGGLGAGSAFEDPVSEREWIHITAVYNTNERSEEYPTGYISIYKNGEWRETSNLIDYSIVPRNGDAPLRIGTRDMESFLKGAVGKFAIYGYELPAKRVRAHYEQMTSPTRKP